jgi:phosphoglycerate dehydrogenase-like enzyme
MVRIAVLDDYQHVAEGMADWSAIPNAEVTFFHDTLKDEDSLVARLEPFEILATMRERTRLPANVLDRLPNLKLLAGTGARQAHVDMEAAARNGVVVCGTGGGGGSTTGELAWGLIISLMKHIPSQDQALRQGQWQKGLVSDMVGKTLGIMGLGRIGAQMASIAHAFGMPVIAWSRTLTPERAAEHGAIYVSWDELFTQSDVVTVHVPLSDISRGWITARELGLMKPTAYLINTSRGPIVQEEALLDALRNRTIAGAGLDVYDQEPLPAGHPILSLDNVVVTPHLGYATEETLSRWYRDIVDNINAYLQGEPHNVLT